MTAKTIVIVDDEENVGASLRLVLEGAGYAVAVCRSGADFRRRLARAHADAYLLDVRLPDAQRHRHCCRWSRTSARTRRSS